MFMVTDKAVVAVDAPPTIGNNYLKAIAEVTVYNYQVITYPISPTPAIFKMTK
jgi:hypothetical protein